MVYHFNEQSTYSPVLNSTVNRSELKPSALRSGEPNLKYTLENVYYICMYLTHLTIVHLISI